jgi:CubicO group peptidase (beta-lactamase class C family)
MESDASWSIDSRKYGEVKAFCCLNATARDFAKFGRLYLNMGNWNGKQVVPRAWVERSITPYTQGQNFYSTQWWLDEDRFAAIGFMGQYICVDPKTKTIIVRLGRRQGKVDWEKIFNYLDKTI